MEIEKILSVLQLVSIITALPCTICLMIAGVIVIRQPIGAIRKQVYEAAHPPAPVPEPPKKRVVTATVPTEVKEHLESLFQYQAKDKNGWHNANERNT